MAAHLEHLFADDAMEGAAWGLLALMSGISEEYWCAGWMSGNELSLWRARQKGPMRYGQGYITQRQCDLLRLLSEEAGGWWAWSDDTGSAFVPLEEWASREAAKLAEASL